MHASTGGRGLTGETIMNRRTWGLLALLGVAALFATRPGAGAVLQLRSLRQRPRLFQSVRLQQLRPGGRFPPRRFQRHRCLGPAAGHHAAGQAHAAAGSAGKDPHPASGVRRVSLRADADAHARGKASIRSAAGAAPQPERPAADGNLVGQGAQRPAQGPAEAAVRKGATPRRRRSIRRR